MSRNELIAKIEALNEWEAMMEEAKTEADAIRSSIKAEMEERALYACGRSGRYPRGPRAYK